MTGIPTRTEGQHDSGDPPARPARALSVRSSVLVLAFAVLVVLSSAAAVSMLKRQKPVTKNGACPFPDGISYCDMARGALGRHPYSYRPLVPLAAEFTCRSISNSTNGETDIMPPRCDRRLHYAQAGREDLRP